MKYFKPGFFLGLVGVTATVLSLLLSATASAHLPGQPSFLKINSTFVDYYTVQKKSVAGVEIPQSMDVSYHLPGEQISFSIDRKLLGVAYSNAGKMQFGWEFGDGAAGVGDKQTHAYAEPGTYILKITGQVPGEQPRLIESTAIHIFPDANFQMPSLVLRAGDKRVVNNTEEIRIETGKEIVFEAQPSQDLGPDAQYFWDFGDSTSATGKTVTHTYNSGFTKGYPFVKVTFKGTFMIANAAWVSTGKEAATQESEAGPGLYERLSNNLKKGVDTVFKDGAINVPLAVLILLFAVVAGAFHSLTPGHGKTILAALLVGRDGSHYRDLFILTASITIAHTIVIYALGFVFLALDSNRSVNSLLPYFEKASAILVLILAAYLIRTGIVRLRRARAHTHAHTHGEKHSHDHGADHSHHHDIPTGSNRNAWTLMVAGAGGGIVPCIDALSLMLLAAGIGHPGFGLVLVLFFSLGLAGTITLIGLLLLAGKKRLLLNNKAEQKIAIYAPLISGVIILILALVLLQNA